MVLLALLFKRFVRGDIGLHDLTNLFTNFTTALFFQSAYTNLGRRSLHDFWFRSVEL